MTEVRLLGLAELQRALETLPAKIEANIMRGAMAAGAKVLAEEAKDRVPERTGALAQSIRYGARYDRKTGRMVGRVRVGGRGKGKRAAAFYAHMVEFGTAAHIIKAPPGARLNVRGLFLTSVSHPGAKRQPFLRPALDAGAAAALQAVSDYVRRRLAVKHGIDVPGPVDPGESPDATDDLA